MSSSPNLPPTHMLTVSEKTRLNLMFRLLVFGPSKIIRLVPVYAVMSGPVKSLRLFFFSCLGALCLCYSLPVLFWLVKLSCVFPPLWLLDPPSLAAPCASPYFCFLYALIGCHSNLFSYSKIKLVCWSLYWSNSLHSLHRVISVQ